MTGIENGEVMKINTERLVLDGWNRDKIDFTKVKDIEEYKKFIIDNYVLLCRKCASENFCKFYIEYQDSCPLLVKVVNNYIDMNIKAINVQNSFEVKEFTKSTIYLIMIFNSFENWRGTYVDEEFNWFFESAHPRLNSSYAHGLLVNISKFVKAYRVVKIDREKKFHVLVEGYSEYEALPSIFQVLGLWNAYFINLKGKDSIQLTRIKDILTKYKEDNVSYFLIFDNDEGVDQYMTDLEKEGLIEKGHYIIWPNKFEDNFGEDAILKILKEIEIETFDKITIEELMECNSTRKDIEKSINYLLHKKEMGVKFKDYKVILAQKLAKWICKEIEESMRFPDGVHNGRRTPKSESFPEFVEKLRQMAIVMLKIESDFHVIKK